MNSWGFAVYTPYEEEIFSDFGYETEKEAEEAMHTHIAYNKIDTKIYRVAVEQRWIDI